VKIFNVSVRVSITLIAELPDNPPEATKQPFSDDPLKKAEALFDRAEKFMAPRPPDGAQMTQNVRIQAETYEDLQAILKMFADTVRAIHKVPDSLLPTMPAF
jgi:DNA-directed RNA polymerase specialized sigma24 family protein